MAFQDFRDIMDVWDESLYEEAEDGKIDSLLDGGGNILFFEKDGDIFGTGEDSRVVFAKLKHPDEEMPKKWSEEASFTADNLTKTIKGEPSRHVFSKSDLKSIKVVNRDDAFNTLKSTADDMGNDAFPPKGAESIPMDKIIHIIRPHKDPDEAPNFVQADEEE